jgi:hypothetical protein
MQSLSQIVGRSWIRRLACIGAAILLLAQTAGAAHFHPLPSAHQYVTNTAVVADNGLCALCLVRFHSPVTLIVAPHPRAPMLAEFIAFGASSRALRLSYRSHPFGRAPPVSV